MKIKKKDDRLKISGIVDSFSFLSKFYATLDDEKDRRLQHELYPIIAAMRDERLDLLASAVTCMINDTKPTDSPSKLKEDAKILAFNMSNTDWLLDAELTKADIVEILRVKHPHLYATLPISKRGMTNWWKEVGCHAKQQREW